MAVVSELTVKVNDNLDQVNKNLAATVKAYKNVEQQASRASASLQSAQRSLERQSTTARNAVLAIGAAFGAATKAFTDYDTAATNVQNITDKTAEEMDSLRSAVLGLPPELGEATDLMGALYQTLSSGVPEKNAIEFLELHARAAKGNLADLTQTVDAGSSIMNAYSLDIGEMGKVLDSMTKTVDLGKLTFQDLSDNIGKGISIAQSAGASYQELFAILATLTLNGQNVEEAMTGVRNVMLASLKPTTQAAKAAERLGADLSAAKLKNEGFAKWMGDIAKAVDGDAEATAALFPNIRALNAAMKLASEEGGAKYNDILNQIENSTGKASDNFDRMSVKLGAQFDAMIAEVKKLGIAFGTVFETDLLKAVKSFRELTESIRGLSPETKSFIVDTGKMLLAVSGMVLILPKLIKGYLFVSDALTGVSAAQSAQQIAAAKTTLAWKEQQAASALARVEIAKNAIATKSSTAANTAQTISLKESQAAMALQRVETAKAALATKEMAAAARAAEIRMGLLSIALMASYEAGILLEKWFDSMNKLTPEFKQNLEEATKAEISFAEATKEMGVSAAQLIKQFGSLENAMKEAAKPLSEFHDAYMALQKDTEEQRIAEEFERIIKSAGAWEELAAGWESIDNMVRAGKDGVGALGTAYEAAVKSVKMMQEQEKKLAQIEKDKAALQKKIIDEEKRYRSSILARSQAALKAAKEEAKAHKEAMDDIKEKYNLRLKEIDLYYKEQEEIKKTYDDLEELFTIGGKVNAGVLSVFEGLEQEAKDTLSQTQEYINNNPLMFAIIPEGGNLEEIYNEIEIIGGMFSETIGDALYEGIHGNLPSLRTVFHGFTDDIGDYLYGSLSDSLNRAFSEAADAMLGAGGEGEGGLGEGIGAFFGALDKDFWLDAGAGIATAFMGKSQQDADKLGAAISGGIAGAMIGTKILPGIGTAIGFVLGAIIGYFGASKAETPKARARVGYFGGVWDADLMTKDAQKFTADMAETWGQQQAAVFDSIKSGYRKILESFGDPSLLEGLTLDNLPSFGNELGVQFQDWVESNADDLGKWLQETYWPEAFREYFRAALETGLGGFGVTDASISALFGELERLPGTQTMQALADFVQAVVGSSRMLEDLDFGAVWEDVLQTPRQAMQELGQQVAEQLEVWASGWEGLTGIEQARQLIQITDLIGQARESEIQYLQQINGLQQQMFRNISLQMEQLEFGGMTEQEQLGAQWEKLQWILGQLEGGGLDAQTISQLTSDAQRYITGLQGILGDDLDKYISGYFADFGAGFLPEDMFEAFKGGTAREGLLQLLSQLRDASQAASQEIIDESSERIAEYNRILEDANLALLTFGDTLESVNDNMLNLDEILEGISRDQEILETPYTEEPNPNSDKTYNQEVNRVMEGMINEKPMTYGGNGGNSEQIREMMDRLQDIISSAVEKIAIKMQAPVVINKLTGSAAPFINEIKTIIMADMLSTLEPGGME